MKKQSESKTFTLAHILLASAAMFSVSAGIFSAHIMTTAPEPEEFKPDDYPRVLYVGGNNLTYKCSRIQKSDSDPLFFSFDNDASTVVSYYCSKMEFGLGQ